MPTTLQLSLTADAAIDEGNPTTCYGTEPVFGLRTMAPGFPRGPRRRTVLAAALDQVPRAAAVTSAVLTLRCLSAGGSTLSSGRVYSCESFDEATTNWSYREFVDTFPLMWSPPGAAGGDLLAEWDLPAAPGVVAIDLTAAVDAANAAGVTNLYMLLRASSEMPPLYECEFASREHATPEYRPVLEVTYSVEGYVLYRGDTPETVDFDTPAGFAPPGSVEITEWEDTHPTGTGTYVYCVCGVGPGGVVTPPHETAYYEVEYVDGVRVLPPPAPPVEWSIRPYRDGQVEFAVVVDQSRGRVPAAQVHCLEYDSGLPGEPVFKEPGTYVPVPADSGRHILVFVIDPAAAHGATVGYAVRAVSAEDVEETNTVVRFAEVDSEGPPAVTDFTVEAPA